MVMHSKKIITLSFRISSGSLESLRMSNLEEYSTERIEKKDLQCQTKPTRIHRVDRLDIIGSLASNEKELGQLRVLIAEGLEGGGAKSKAK